MIETNRKVFYCVTGADPEEFQRNMNEKLANLKAPEITFPNIPLTAYIVAEEWTRIAETLEEQHLLNKDTYRCASCPYFERTNDLRRKWHYCVYHQQKVRSDEMACEEFYQQVDSGTIEPRKRGGI